MADTSSKKMDQKNVVYPPSRHALLAVYGGMKTTLPTILQERIDGPMDKLDFAKADKLIKEAKAKAEDAKEVYFKIGVIGSDLVLRVKSQDKGFMQIFGFDQKDALLLHGVSLKKASDNKPAGEIKFDTVYVLVPGDCKPIVNEYFDMGKGFGLKLSVTVDGAGKSTGIDARVKDVHKALIADYRKDAKKIADDLAATLTKLTVRSGTTLEKAAADAQAELEKLLDQAKVQKAFEKQVGDMIAADKNFRQHATEWKIKGVCTAIITTIKLATAIARAIASHGADVHAYVSIVQCGKAYYTLIDDFTKAEATVASELDQAIALYVRSANGLLDEMEAIWKENKLTTKTKVQQLQAAVSTAKDGLAMAQDKLTKKIKDVTGKDVAQKPEELRRRYLVELGKLLGGLDSQASTLGKSIDDFKKSSINSAVQTWPKIQALKKACDDARGYFAGRKKYAEDAKARIVALGIAVDDSTDFTKLKKMVEGVRELNKDKVLGGGGPVATVGSTVRSAYQAVSALVTQVEAFA